VFLLGQDAKPDQIRQLRTDLGLDQPFFVQFWHFLGNAAQGEFGLSLRQGAKVSRLIGERFPATLELALVAAVVAVVLGIPMGVYAALRRGTFMSQVFLTLSLLGVSLPTFLIGILLILVFAVILGWFPSFGRGEVVAMGWWKTGLLTAAAWQEKAGRAVLRSERGDQPASVLVLDLDHFKLVNDRFGHLVGDQVLAAVAASLRDEVRDEDLVGRFGGEEFVVLLKGTDGDDPRSGARAVAERIRERIAALRVAVAGPQETAIVEGLTVSIGGATTSRDGTDLAALLEIADAAMYEAKRAGRNLVRMGLPVNIPPQLRRVDRT